MSRHRQHLTAKADPRAPLHQMAVCQQGAWLRDSGTPINRPCVGAGAERQFRLLLIMFRLMI